VKYKETYKDLFTVDSSYYLVHCIASDFHMGAGIAVLFQKKFSLRNKLKNSIIIDEPGSCILIGRVFNLITKRRSSGKPTYDTLRASLEKMRNICEWQNINKIAMPKIGCGLDRLQWGKVSEMIKEIFNDTSVEILVCKWKG
jgi:O-acetyl-ADP-ribose deacetylase (regulator of RNase III)